MAQMEAISDLSGGKCFHDLNAQVGDALSAFEKTRAGAPEEAPHEFSTVGAVFDAMPAAFVPKAAAGVDVVFQYSISGSDGGDWHCIVRDGACTVASGLHEGPTCTLKMADTEFLRMMNGQLTPMQAFTSGKLKIEGDIMKSQLIERLFKLQ